jgi:hypothetical protein
VHFIVLCEMNGSICRSDLAVSSYRLHLILVNKKNMVKDLLRADHEIFALYEQKVL